MKKSTKGAIAAGAAAVLLMGGAGSLAYWNATDTAGGGTINSGVLQLTEPTGGVWTLNTDPVADISSVVIVPGDELEYNAEWTIAASGDNLQADVTVTGLDASGGLEPFVDVTSAFEVDGVTASTITEENDGDTLAATVDVDFPFGDTVDNDSQALTLDLSEVTVTLTQTDATP